MQIAEAQADLRRSFVGGGPGVVVSGLVWGVAAAVESAAGVAIAFAVLFLGGMLIFPISLAVSRLLFGRAGLQPENRLSPIALESTAAMIAGLLAAYLLIEYEPRFVFPVAALVVGAHYFAFRTLYGDPVFLLLGALVAAIALNGAFSWVSLPGGVLWQVAAVEIAVGALLTARAPRA